MFANQVGELTSDLAWTAAHDQLLGELIGHHGTSRTFVSCCECLTRRRDNFAAESEAIPHLVWRIEESPDHVGSLALNRLLGESDTRVQRNVDLPARARPTNHLRKSERRQPGYEGSISDRGTEFVESPSRARQRTAGEGCPRRSR